MMTDICKPRPGDWDDADGEWCSATDLSQWHTDITEIVHTYSDTYSLAGISVEEEYGVEMAVIIEDPLLDPDPQYDDPLWGLSHALQSTLVAARDSDLDNIRDVTVADLESRFDADLNGCTAPNPGDPTFPYVYRENNFDDFGLPCNAFQVEHYNYASTDSVFEFMSNQVDTLFNTYYESLPPAQIPASTNLLFVREVTSRAVMYGETSAACVTPGDCTFDFSTQPIMTRAVMNWAPYERNGGAWDSYPIQDYLDVLEANLRVLDEYQPEDESLAAKQIVDGQIYMARSFYEGMYRGVAMLVALNGEPLVNIPSELRDDFIYNSYYLANRRGQVATKVVKNLVENLVRGLEKNPILSAEIAFGLVGIRKGFFKAIGEGLKGKVTDLNSKLSKLGGTLAQGIFWAAIAVIVVAAVVGLVLYLAGGDGALGRIGARILYSALSLITTTLAVGSLLSAISAVKAAQQVSSAAKTAAIVGLVIGVIVAWVVFFISWDLVSEGAGSLAVNNLAADAMAATATIVLFALLAMTGYGLIAVAIIGVIDGLIALVCYATGQYEDDGEEWAQQYLCAGISGWITKIFKWIFYSQTFMIDYDNTDRLEFNNLAQDLNDPLLGMVPGNTISYTLGVTNTITLSDVPIDWKQVIFFYQFNDDTAKSSTFTYKVQPTETDIHGGLERFSNSGLWQGDDDDDQWYYNYAAQTDGFTIDMPSPGINQAPVAFFSEGSAVPVQECFAVPSPFWPGLFPVCYIRTETATIHSDLGPSLNVDVFPATLDEFYTLVEISPNAVSLAWGRDNDNALTFPVIKDADGDGLISAAHQGNDPNDALYDTDNDGVSDYYEVIEGMNPRLPDTDGDGLNDGDELRYNTDPKREDSDGDGLTDDEEIQGWLFTYDFAANGTPLETRVYSNPLVPDTDYDGLTDLLEKVYGFNPRVSQEVNVLEYTLGTRELDAPLIGLRFDEPVGSSVFVDSSNFGFSAACLTDACPQAGVAGRFAKAVQLDGDDALNLSTSAQVISLDQNAAFTIAGWVYPESDGVILSKWSEATDYKQELIFRLVSGGTLQLTNSTGTSINSSSSIPTNTWSHLAATFDGSQVRFYINGTLDSSGGWSNPTAAGTIDSEIMLGARMGATAPTGHFTGKLDEIMVFDQALSQTEIADRQMVARYNFDDSFVRPGEEFVYVSVIKNLLNSRFGYGLLTTLFSPREAILGWETKLQPETFVLWPDNPVATGINTAVISETLQIDPAYTVSTDLIIDQTVAAQIVDRRAESNFAELWLKLNEPVAATNFEDSSGNMPPRNVDCTACPTTGQPGILNNAILFTAGVPRSIELPDLATLEMVDRGYTAAMWVKPSSTGTSMTLLKGAGNKFSLTLAKNGSGDYVPHVYVNGIDRTPALSLWRVIIPDVWNHLAVRYADDGTMDIFINGARVTTLAGIPAINANAALNLGDTQTATFSLDDLRLFSRPLSTGDINRLAERPVIQLKMDNGSFSDTSIYSQDPTYRGTQPTPQGSSIRGTSLTTGAGSSLGYLQVNGNELLNMEDGAFTFSVWVNPAAGATSNAWQGIFGWNSGDANAYPTLERKGNRLRFSFGNGTDFESYEITADVLTPDQWNHVVVTMEPEQDAFTGVPTGRYLFNLYVDGQNEAGFFFDSHPTTTATLYVGHSSKKYTSTATNLHVTGIGGDPGSYAEVKIFRNSGGSNSCLNPFCSEKDVKGTNNYAITTPGVTVTDDATVHYWIVEYDSTSANDQSGDAYNYWYEEPYSKNWTASNGISGHLTVVLDRPSIQFFGHIDELEVYRYALDSEQVFDLFNAIPITARLPLDDRPASDSFENTAFIGVQDNGICSGGSCPAAGTIGLINQAARFDGADDVITVPSVQTTSNYMVSLWVNTFCTNCGLYTLKSSSGGSTINEIYLRNGNVCAKTGVTEMCSVGGTIPDEQWHHVVYSNNGSTANLWLDGAIVNTIPFGSSLSPAPNGEAQLGYAAAAGQDYLNGQIDDVRVFRESQDASVVSQLKRRAPLALFPLDEATTAAGMQDATPQDWTLNCAGGQCPEVDRTGRLSTAAEFDGVNDLFSLTQPQLSGTTRSFSVGVWVMPTKIAPNTQTLWVLSNAGGSAPKYSLATAPDSLKLCVLNNTANGTCPAQSNVDLIQNVWNFVLVTVDRPPGAGSVTENVKVYINGYLDFETSGNTGTAAALNGLGRLYLGNKPAGFGGLAGGAFGGRLDEASIYEYLMTEIDVRDTFHYQMAQVEEYDALTLTIDAEDPLVSLVNYNPAFPYFRGVDTLMQVSASDATSGIAMVEMEVEYQSLPNLTYQVAPVCLDSLEGNAFCPTFNPDAGDGTYTLNLRAVDAVGHQSPIGSYTAYVDAAGPRLTFNQLNNSLQHAQPHTSLRDTWHLSLSGTILDELLSDGVDGSGVDLNSVWITVQQENGDVVGYGAQRPVLTPAALGYNWQIDYLFPEREPTGLLTVVIEAKDRVGNQSTRQISVLLDATPPTGTLDLGNLPNPDLLNPTTRATNGTNPAFLRDGTLTGDVSDIPTEGAPYLTPGGGAATSGISQVDTAFTPDVNTSYLFNEPYPEGLLAWLPLDGDKIPVDIDGNPVITATQRLFLDISPYQIAGICEQPECPQAGILGHKMGSTYFSGSGQYISLGQQVDLANRSFTISIWAKPDRNDRNDPMLWQGPVSIASRRIVFGLNAQRQFVCGFGGTDLITPESYPDTNWHHWACAFDEATGARTIFRDGQAIVSDSASPLPVTYENLLIGLAPVGSFLGYLDELVIHDFALDNSQIRQQYTAYNTVFHLAVEENFYVNGDSIPDSSGYFHSTVLSTSGDIFNKVTAGKVGLFGLAFDGNDKLVVPSAFSLQLDRAAFTQAAWIFPTGGSGDRDIISQRNENPEERYPSLILKGDNSLEAGFGNLFNWNSVCYCPWGGR